MGWKFRAVAFMRYICHKIELGTSNLIFTLQTFNNFEASCLAMDALCYFHGNQDICQMHGHTAMCNSVCSVQYKQILKECISGWILCSIWHLNIWKAGDLDHPLFKMSAGNNSGGNANESLGQSQYLSNYTSCN